jgi:DNA-3-methyladenine glycosylase II
MQNQTFDAEATHARFIDIAGGVSPRLAEDMSFIGPVEFPDRRHMGLCTFLAQAVVNQMISTHAAASIWGRFENLIAENGGAMQSYLTPGHADALRGCGISGPKVKTLIAIGEALNDGLSEEMLDSLSMAERNERLIAIWGIGQWTCDMASIFYFGEPDIWPDGDVAVMNTFKRYLGRKKPNTQARRFAPQRSVLALYMWQIVHRMP